MKIEEITVYQVGNQQFATRQAAQNFLDIDKRIEEIMSPLPKADITDHDWIQHDPATLAPVRRALLELPTD